MHNWCISYQYSHLDLGDEVDLYLVPEYESTSHLDLGDGLDSYLAPESLLNLMSSGANNVTGNIPGNEPLPSISRVWDDTLVRKLEAQFADHSDRRAYPLKNMYDQKWSEEKRLTQSERLELASRYEASGDQNYQLKTMSRGMFSGEKHIVYANKDTKKVPVNFDLLELIRNNR